MEVFKFALNFVEVMSKHLVEKITDDFELRNAYYNSDDRNLLKELIKNGLNEGIMTNLGIEEKMTRLGKLLNDDSNDANKVLDMAIAAVSGFNLLLSDVEDE